MLLVALVVAAGSAAASVADEPDIPGSSRAAFLTRGVGARPVGMGEAFTAVADDASAQSWNPAGLGRLGSPAAIATYDVVGEGMGLSYAAGAVPVGPGVAGLALTAFTFGSYEVRDAAGQFIMDESPLDAALAASWGMPNPGWCPVRGWTGAGLEVVSEYAGGFMFGANFGTLAPVAPRLTAGVAVLHLGPASGGFSLPATVRAGLAWTIPPIAVVAMDAGYEFPAKLARVSVGAEVIPYRFVALRAGYRLPLRDEGITGLTGLTAGLGARIGRFGLDYAYQPFGELATSHRVAIVYGPAPAAPVAAVPGVAEDRSPVPAVSAEDEYRASATLYDAGKYDEAAARAAAAVRADPRHWQGWQMIGNCRYAKGDLKGALEAYRESLAINPENPGLAKFYKEQGGK